MNNVVKRKLIGSILCIIIGVVCLVYLFVSNNSISEELHSYVCGFTGGILGVGIYTLIISIGALMNKEKGKILENTVNDERLNKINAYAMSLTFKISMLLQAAISIVGAFSGKMQISQFFGFAISIQLVIYLIVYFIVKSKN